MFKVKTDFVSCRCRPYLDYLELGESIDNFLEGFPTVDRQQVVDLLEASTEAVLAQLDHDEVAA